MGDVELKNGFVEGQFRSFHVGRVLTVSGATKYSVEGRVVGEGGEAEVELRPLMGKTAYDCDGSYCLSPAEGHILGNHPVIPTRLQPKAHALVSTGVHRFLSDHAARFEKLRKASTTFQGIDGGEKWSEVTQWYRTTLVVGDLANSRDLEMADRGEISYRNVGFDGVLTEVVEDKENNTGYAVVYQRAEDKGKKPPLYFVVIDFNEKERPTRAFVHNYNEDMRAQYIAK